MINAKELRIGNYVYCRYDIGYCARGIIQVETIGRDGINAWQDMGASGVGKFEDLQPVPLTPELLEKAGIKEGGVFFLNEEKDTTLELGCEGERYWLCIEKDGYNTDTVYLPHEIGYLHELQNLFYCLTGQELEINL